MLQILVKIIISLFLLMGVVWILLPWNFAAHNYARTRHIVLAALGWSAWGLLLSMHFGLIYLFWFADVTYWWLILLMVAHLFFMVIFGRDLSTH